MEISSQFLMDLINPESGVSLENVLILKAGDENNSPKILQESYDAKDLEGLRRELPLNLLNFLREEMEPILLSSQACGQTPLKATHPSKYKYESPIKPLHSTPKIQDNNRSKKNGRKLNMDTGAIRKNSNQKKLEDRLSGSLTPLKLNEGTIKGKSAEKSSKKRCSLDLNVSPREWRPDIPIQPEKRRGKKSNKRRSDPIPINISCDSEDSINKSPMVKENLANITEDYKKKFDNCNQLAQITCSLDKSHNETNSTENNTIDTSLTTLLQSPMKFMNSNDASMEFIEPSLVYIQEEDKSSLERLAQLYNLCIDHRLVPNILVELHLVLQLFTVKHQIQCSKPISSITRKAGLFVSVHNCVYFASMVLTHQVHLFRHLNHDAIGYLVENNRLQEFCPENVKETLESYKQEAKRDFDPVDGSSVMNSLESVRFQEETDSRDNFPDSNTFTDFKKQRDSFYELLKNWELSYNDFNKGSKNRDQFGFSVIKILKLQENPINLRHFARLFTKQMLINCLKEDKSRNLEDKMDDASYSYSYSNWKLQSRFGRPKKCQEFFKEFLSVSTYSFIVHLKEEMKDMIVSMNDTNFNLDDDIPIMEIGNLILELRILAKYLAMIEVLPFCKHGSNVPLHFQESQLKLRENDFKKPSVDFNTIIAEALRRGRLVITLPWIIEYCSMLDFVGAKLEYFQEIFKKLVSIYKSMTLTGILPTKPIYTSEGDIIEDILSPMKNVSLQFQGNKKKDIGFNQFFLCIHLGWLFENSTFPREYFVDDVSNIVVVDIGYSDKKTIDSCKSIHATLLYDCCPYLNELNVVLKSQKIHKNAPIIPIKRKKSTPMNKSENMQEKLEAHFFYYTQGSVLEIVNLIIKRVTSNFVSILGEKIAEDAKYVLKEISENVKILNEDNFKEELIAQVRELSRMSFQKINYIAREVVEEELKRRVDAALTSLMPDDTKDSKMKARRMKVCREYIEKRVKNQAKNWTKEKYSEEYFRELYQKDFDKLWHNRLETSVKQSAMVCCDLKQKSAIVIPLHEILIQLKNDTSMMVIDRVNLEYSEETLLNFLKNIEASYAAAFLDASVDDKPDLDQNVKGFEHMSFDWTLALFTFNPKLMTSNVQEKIISLWGGRIPNQNEIQFALSQPPVAIFTLFSRRNLHLLGKSQNATLTWEKMEHFIGRLLKHLWKNMAHLHDQCLALMQPNSKFLEEYPPHLKKRFGSCLKGVYETWKKTNKHHYDEDDDAFWTDWFGWAICSIDDDEDFPELR